MPITKFNLTWVIKTFLFSFFLSDMNISCFGSAYAYMQNSGSGAKIQNYPSFTVYYLYRFIDIASSTRLLQFFPLLHFLMHQNWFLLTALTYCTAVRPLSKVCVYTLFFVIYVVSPFKLNFILSSSFFFPVLVHLHRFINGHNAKIEEKK